MVQSSNCERGVVPFENSTHGPVVFTLDLLIDRDAKYPDLRISGETYLPIHHCLLGHLAKDPAVKQEAPKSAFTSATKVLDPNDPAIQKIQHIYSHPQAFGQCDIFLSKYLQHAERHEVSSTSKAAQLVAADPSGTSAAIASRLAAEVHNLDFLASGTEDKDDNATRFFVLQRSPSHISSSSTEPIPPSPVPNPDYNGLIPIGRRSLIAFKVNHSQPGALAGALAVFEPHELNLTSINSRPSLEMPWHYTFLIEVDDHEGGSGSTVADALKDLEKFTREPKFLGSWVEVARNGVQAVGAGVNLTV